MKIIEVFKQGPAGTPGVIFHNSEGLRNLLSDPIGTGSVVFNTNAVLVTPILGTPTSGNLANCTFPTLNQDTTGNADTATLASKATNIAGGSGGQIPYQSAVNTTALLANGTAGQILKSNGTTLAPSWANSRIVLASSADPVSTLLITTEIELFSHVITAGLMTANKAIELNFLFSNGFIDSNEKIVKVYFNSTVIATLTITENPSVRSIVKIQNRNNQASQICHIGILSAGMVTLANTEIVNTAEDTTASSTISIKATTPSNITLEMVSLEMI